LPRFPSRRDVALARQVTELTNQRIRFDMNPEPTNGYRRIQLDSPDHWKADECRLELVFASSPANIRTWHAWRI